MRDNGIFKVWNCAENLFFRRWKSYSHHVGVMFMTDENGAGGVCQERDIFPQWRGSAEPSSDSDDTAVLLSSDESPGCTLQKDKQPPQLPESTDGLGEKEVEELLLKNSHRSFSED